MAVTSALVDSTTRNGSTGTTSTVTGVQFGSAFAGRVICVFFYCNNFTQNPTAVTIGGVSATRTGTFDVAGILMASAVVPTGTSGSVVATFSSSDQAVVLGAVALTGAASGIPSDTINDDSGPNTIDVGAGGCIVAYGGGSGSGSWTGCISLVTLGDDSIGSFDNAGGALTNRTVGYESGFNVTAAAFDAAGGGGSPKSRPIFSRPTRILRRIRF